MLDKIKNLKTLSIATLILVPLIPSVILLSILVLSGPREGSPGLAFFFISFILIGVFAGILATIQLQLKRKLQGEEGFFIRISPALSVILSLIIIITYVLIEIKLRVRHGYGYLYPILNLYAILFLFFPLLSVYTAIQVTRGKKNKTLNFLCNISYGVYALFPVLFLIFMRVTGG